MTDLQKFIAERLIALVYRVGEQFGIDAGDGATTALRELIALVAQLEGPVRAGEILREAAADLASKAH